VHFRLGETGRAIFQLERALESDPSDLDTHYCLYTIYQQAGMEHQALEQLRILKAGEGSRTLLDLFSQHGRDNFRLGHYAEAIHDYELAIQVDPTCTSLYVNLGDLYYLVEQPRTALETWCRGLWAGYSNALAERLQAVAEETGALRVVVTMLRDCLTHHPEDGRYHFLLAKLLREAGEAREAMALLEDTVRLAPHLVEAQEQLGQAYARLGRAEMANATFRAGLSAARTREVVYQCTACGYVTKQEQQRCFRCNRWGTLQRTTREDAESRESLPESLLERGNITRSLNTFWSKVVRQLTAGS
jgi:tetratricopeptide (TPR) repeat protein